MTTASERLGDIAGETPANPPAQAPAASQTAGNGLNIERRQKFSGELDTTRETPLWEQDDAPDGSTESSLLVYENGVPVRVSGPTHYAHLANGEIVGGYGIGTHHDGGNGPVPIVAHYAG